MVCVAVNTIRKLFKIEGTLNQLGDHSILQRHSIPSGLRLVGPSFIFQQDNDPKHTSRLCKGYLTKKESDGVLCQTTCPPQSPDLNPIETVWDDRPQTEGQRANNRSAPLGTPSTLFKIISGGLPHEAHQRIRRL